MPQTSHRWMPGVSLLLEFISRCQCLKIIVKECNVTYNLPKRHFAIVYADNKPKPLHSGRDMKSRANERIIQLRIALGAARACHHSITLRTLSIYLPRSNRH
eukprot:scaffold309962_cov32-Prasinocladus_malaysianus.AAC.5